MTRYNAMVILDAIDPMSVESAYINVRAGSEFEARQLVELFVKRDVKIRYIAEDRDHE